ncbi:hypothetical protein [Aeribacillus pallidus]|uniref:hypothetical protein n=1 Tax=Aeribacillus pallidus TaxID=33936 RepID=UPI003D1BA6CD
MSESASQVAESASQMSESANRVWMQAQWPQVQTGCGSASQMSESVNRVWKCKHNVRKCKPGRVKDKHNAEIEPSNRKCKKPM